MEQTLSKDTKETSWSALERCADCDRALIGVERVLCTECRAEYCRPDEWVERGRDLELGIGLWAESTFSQATDRSILTHLRREALELREALDRLLATVPGTEMEWSDLRLIGDEVADCYMLFCHLCVRHNVPVFRVLQDKFTQNQKRKWGKPDGEGVVEHLREKEEITA